MPELLRIIADNPALTQALRELLEGMFRIDRVSTNQTNEEMGQIIRANIQGMENIREAFKEIERHKSVKEKESNGLNPAR